MPFSKSVADEALVACGRRCCICRQFAGTKMQLHHIKPEAEGGEDSLENSIPLCLACHAEVACYNSSHPIGRKFSESELKRHRDLWFDFVKAHPERLANSPGSLFRPDALAARTAQFALFCKSKFVRKNFQTQQVQERQLIVDVWLVNTGSATAQEVAVKVYSETAYGLGRDWKQSTNDMVENKGGIHPGQPSHLLCWDAGIYPFHENDDRIEYAGTGVMADIRLYGRDLPAQKASVVILPDVLSLETEQRIEFVPVGGGK
jgi:hypothetical protein